ncbi:MAG: NAD(P)H-hydrate dehydratase [Bacteroidetes bacterium]|nr:NAD(P)H-hydrate dehydratase [Bacteroidota bacterium]
MKILPVTSIRTADDYTIKNEPIASVDLMERAANGCFQWLDNNNKLSDGITIFCGMGNNGGDGLAIARLLYNSGKSVQVIIIKHSDKPSADFEINLKRLQHLKVTIHSINAVDEIPEISFSNLIIDAILGSGLNKATEGLIAEVIKHINTLPNNVVAIDVPSGLFCDKTNAADDIIIKAGITLSFQFPKLAFMFPQNAEYVGEWKVLPIGLCPEFIKNEKCNHFLIDAALIKSIYKSRNKFAHKGDFGHALLICGSKGKMGAAILSSKACLRSGAGLLSVHCPGIGESILQTAVPEAMCEADSNKECFSDSILTEKYDAIGIGSGIGTSEPTSKAFTNLLKQCKKPILIDADGINLLAENKANFAFIPENSILTPHFKEFERITKKVSNDFERNQLQIDLSVKYRIYIVLKGAHTAISTPEGNCYFNNTGNAGMATAGSGDVLTGIICGLLAQKYSPLHAALLGVYLHGLAGDCYAEKYAKESLIAGDIIENLGKAFNKIIN